MAGPVEVLRTGDQPIGSVTAVRVGPPGGRRPLREQLVRLDDECTHQGGPLGEGDLVDDGVLRCPWHGARFDVRTGEVLDGSAARPARTSAGAQAPASSGRTGESGPLGVPMCPGLLTGRSAAPPMSKATALPTNTQAPASKSETSSSSRRSASRTIHQTNVPRPAMKASASTPRDRRTTPRIPRLGKKNTARPRPTRPPVPPRR